MEPRRSGAVNTLESSRTREKSGLLEPRPAGAVNASSKTREKSGTVHSVPRRGQCSGKAHRTSPPRGQSGLSPIFRPIHSTPQHRCQIPGQQDSVPRRAQCPAKPRSTSPPRRAGAVNESSRTREKSGTVHSVPRRAQCSGKAHPASTPRGQSGLSPIFRPIHSNP